MEGKIELPHPGQEFSRGLAKQPECRECARLRKQRNILLRIASRYKDQRDDAKRLLNAALAQQRQDNGWRWWEWSLYMALWALMVWVLLNG